MAIASISYTGDFRMTVGEDKQKVANIVQPNIARFKILYDPLLAKESSVHRRGESGEFTQDHSADSRLQLLRSLPYNLQSSLLRKNINTLAESPELCAESVQAGTMEIVKRSSWSQSLKGILTAGLFKSVKYGSKKLSKMWKSKR